MSGAARMSILFGICAGVTFVALAGDFGATSPWWYLAGVVVVYGSMLAFARWIDVHDRRLLAQNDRSKEDF